MTGAQHAVRTTAETVAPTTLLFVGRPNLQTEILAQYLSNALHATCNYAHRHPDTECPGTDTLLLFDCKHLDHSDVGERLEQLYQSDRVTRAILFNVTPQSGFERLILWPCVKGIFFDDCNQQLLLKGMRAVLSGDIWIPRRLLEHAFERQRSTMPLPTNINIKLSKREHDILQLISAACSNVAIAERLHISEHTVKSHLYNIFRKIGVRNRTEASHWAMLHLNTPGE